MLKFNSDIICMKGCDFVGIYGSLIKESKDKSTLEKSFKKKNHNFKIYDLHDSKVLNLPCVKNDDRIREDLKYKIEKGKKGEIAIDPSTGKFIGYVIVNKNEIIGPLYIEKEYRGYGLSNQLFEDAIKKYNGKELGVYSDNEIAMNLYKKFGFEKYSEKNYADGDKVILMKLNSSRV